MPDVNRGNRPLSPFMIGPYYRPQLNSITSILTRITGNALIVGMLLIVWWLLAAATSADYFATADAVLTSWFGDLVLFLSLWALWYHTVAGLRHLVWDQGYLMDVDSTDRLSWAVIGGSILLTILTVLVI